MGTISKTPAFCITCYMRERPMDTVHDDGAHVIHDIPYMLVRSEKMRRCPKCGQPKRYHWHRYTPTP